MPNPKNGTISENPKELIKRMMGGALYRERAGVVRMAIGQLGFTPEMLRDNMRVFINRIKDDIRKLPEDAIKEINEVVLSSTNGPGMSLNGRFRSAESLDTAKLSVA
jgi:large subunit ribosomal protein L1